MTTQATQRITYATMSADPNLHTDIDAAVERVKGMLGKTHPMYIDGKAVTAGAQFEDRSPIDTRIVLGTFQQGGREHVQQAVAAARAAFPAWSGLPWQERVRLLKKVADTIRAHRFDLAVLMIHEVGKNRLECLGDVIETADLIEYYCDEFANHGGYELKMDVLGPNEQNMSVMRPYGVFGVISPFNFPMALAGGPAGGALVAGNTVVFKPATDTPLMGAEVYEMMAEAGLPHGVFNFITGPGRTAGQEIIDNEGIDGIVFTGSMEVGMKLLRDNGARRIRGRSSSRWAARTRRSSRARPTSTRRPTACTARRSARRGRSAPRARAYTCRQRSARSSSSSSSKRRRRSRSATRSSAMCGWALSSTRAR